MATIKTATSTNTNKAIKSIAVFGGRGMLGSDLTSALNAAGYMTRAFDLPECDITQPADIEQALDGADIVVNCAAFTNVDGAEDQPERAEAVNARAVGSSGRG